MKTKLNYLVLACLVTGIIMLSGCKKEPGIPVLNTTNVSQRYSKHCGCKWFCDF